MAATTATLKQVYRQPVGNQTQVTVQVDGEASYVAANFQTILAQQLNLSRITRAYVTGSVVKSTGAPANAIVLFGQPDRLEEGFSQIQLAWCTTPAGGTNSNGDYHLNQCLLVVEGY